MAVLPDPDNWGGSPKPFRGLVVGAVQSGKTGSMIGLTAMALDQGYRIVVVLSGNKDDLRRQTARRFNGQLLRYSEIVPNTGGTRTLDPALSRDAKRAFCLPYSRDAHQQASFHLGLQAALERGEPAVIVIKKHQSSLQDLRSKLEIAFQRFGVASLPLLVLDDECDDASVDREGMPIPTAIAGLWRRNGEQPLAAYVGYTATSAANLLQPRDNDLFPEDFVYLLRHPGAEDGALTFEEASPDLWYTGGFEYYEAFGDEPGPEDNFMVVPCVTPQHLHSPNTINESLWDAVRAFIVAGAFRLALSPEWSFKDGRRFPQPHSMLIQTSASQVDHRMWFDAITSLFGGVLNRKGFEYRWEPESVMLAVSQEGTSWRRWYDEYVKSRVRTIEERPRLAMCGMVTWDQVKGMIPAFVENLRIKIINSEEDSGGELDFSPCITNEGSLARPRDVFTIIIGGAKLSRGLTVEGLCTTYFGRWNPSPTEDTVLQLSRWYGYRGSHLEFCRLFTTPDIHSQLQGMYDNDRELRMALVGLMNARRTPADAAMVLKTNPKALPTGKLGQGRVYDLAFSPFATVYRRAECVDPGLQARNQEAALSLVAACRNRKPERVVAAGGALRGMVSRDWSAVEVADVLDSIGFSGHNPSSVANPASEFYRRPETTRPILGSRTILEDPYQVAAYLRQWAQEGERPPLFNVGIVQGEMPLDIAPFDFPLVNREITPTGEVVGGWTGRRPGWRGDILFDNPGDEVLVPGTAERLPGARGLLLLYVVHKLAIGRHQRGRPRDWHTPMLGIVIPEGGPVWRRVTVDRRRIVSE